MIDRERWLEAWKARLAQNKAEGKNESSAGAPSSDFETAGFHIPQHGSLVLHEGESVDSTASLMRLVSEEAARDDEELTRQAQRLDAYAHKLARTRELGRAGDDGGVLPLYASATPGGRLVVNFCATSPFDETDDALAALDRFLTSNPLGGEVAR